MGGVSSSDQVDLVLRLRRVAHGAAALRLFCVPGGSGADRCALEAASWEACGGAGKRSRLKFEVCPYSARSGKFRTDADIQMLWGLWWS